MPGLSGVLGAGLALIVVAIAVADAPHFIIPNELTAMAFVLGLVHAGVQAPDAALEADVFAALHGGVLALAFLGGRALYRHLRGSEGLGLGDVKLAGVAGAWLDWLVIPFAVEIAALAALSEKNPPGPTNAREQLIALYQRLTAAGKPYKVALVACARKLVFYDDSILT